MYNNTLITIQIHVQQYINNTIQYKYMYNNTLITQYKYMYNNTLITQYNTNTCTTIH